MKRKKNIRFIPLSVVLDDLCLVDLAMFAHLFYLD